MLQVQQYLPETPNDIVVVPSEADQLRETIARMHFDLIAEKSAREYDRMNAEYQNQLIRIDLDYARNALEKERQLVRDKQFELNCAHNTIRAHEFERHHEQLNFKKELQKSKAAREKERKNFLELRKKDAEAVEYLKKENEMFSGQIDTINSGGTIPPPRIEIPCCEICAREYTESPLRTPRVLGCGHTVCEYCAEKLAEKKSLKCPFDRKVTRVKAGVSSLPRNFTIIHMMSMR